MKGPGGRLRRRPTSLFVAALAGLALAAGAQPAFADRASAVRIGRDQNVEYVIAFGVPVRIEGTVREEIIVVGGPLTITGTARILDDVYVLGGTLEVDPSARIDGSLTTVSSAALRLFAPSRATGAAALGILLFVRLVLLGVMGTVAWELSPTAFTARQRERLARRPFRVLGLGLLWATLVGMGAVLASVTLVALPLGLLLGFLLGAESIVGLAVAIGWAREPGRLSAAGPRRVVACLGVLGLLPVVGEIVLYAAAAVGVGVALAALADARGARGVAAAHI